MHADDLLDRINANLPAATLAGEIALTMAIDLGLLDREEVLRQLDRLALLDLAGGPRRIADPEVSSRV